MCRSSPQFGVTLVTYELLQRWFYVDFGGQYVGFLEFFQTLFVRDKVDNTRQPYLQRREALLGFI